MNNSQRFFRTCTEGYSCVSTRYSCQISVKLEFSWQMNSWIKRDQLDVTCFLISLFHAQHVSDVNTSMLRSLRLICWVFLWVVLLWYDVYWCYGVVRLGWCGIRMQAEALVLQHFSDVNTSILRSLRLIVDLFHGVCCSGTMCVGVTVWFGWGGVVSGCRLKH